MRTASVSSLLLVAVCGWALESGTPAPAATPEVQQLTARIAVLEQRLAQLEHPPVVAGAITIPAGSYASGTLLSAVDLENGKSAQVLIQCDVTFVAPGGKQVNVQGLCLMGVATAHVSTRRVTVELSQASLMRADQRLAVAPVQGWVVDPKDGITGPTGQVVPIPAPVREALATAAPDDAEKLLAATNPSITIPTGMAVTVVLAQPVVL